MDFQRILTPEPFRVCSLSFGKDSLATALLCLEKGEPLDRCFYVEVMYCFTRNISAEVPIHRDFIYEKAIPRLQSLGIQIDVMRSPRDYLSYFFETIQSGAAAGKLRGFPMGGRCGISTRCKRPAFNAYARAHRGYDVTWYVGIAADETERLARLRGNKLSLLAKYGMTERDAFDLCKRYDLLSPIYDTNSRNGCWFCPSQSMASFAWVYANYPDLWARLREMDAIDGKASPYFSYRLTLQELENKIRSCPYIENPNK